MPMTRVRKARQRGPVHLRGNRLPGLVFDEMPDGSVDVVTQAGSGDGAVPRTSSWPR